MSVQTTAYPTLINNRPVHNTDLLPLAFSGFAHFTAMQVRNRMVKGIDLHLKRLREASISLFGTSLPDESILHGIRLAIDEGAPDMSLTLTIYLPEGDFRPKSAGTIPAILIRTGAPTNGPTGPLRLGVAEHERGVPQEERKIRLGDLAGLSGAVVMNSWTPGIAVTAIGQSRVPEAKPFMDLLWKAYDAEPAHPV